MEEWARQSALTLAKAIQDKKISSSELLEYFIERYERLNPEINAIVATNFDQARKKAVDALESDDESIKSWAKAMTMEHRDWLFLNHVRSLVRQKWDDYFNDVDVMLCPVTRIPAHPHDHTPIPERVVQFNNETLRYWDVLGPWTSLALVSYLPATVAPAGFTPGGLPVGIQIMGPYLEDLTPIQFAINLEKEIIGPYQLPPGFD